MSSGLIKSIGISRNITHIFQNLRSEDRGRSQPRFSGNSIFSNEPKQPLIGGNSNALHEIPIDAVKALPPEWVDIYDSVTEELKTLGKGMDELKHIQSERLKITFGQQKIQALDRQVSMLTTQILSKIKHCEEQIKQIQNFSGSSDSNARKNAAKTLAKQLQDITNNHKLQ